jgi:hypothetical protein
MGPEELSQHPRRARSSLHQTARQAGDGVHFVGHRMVPLARIAMNMRRSGQMRGREPSGFDRKFVWRLSKLYEGRESSRLSHSFQISCNTPLQHSM